MEADSDGPYQGERLKRLFPFLTGDGPRLSYGDIAREWAVGESAVRVAVHRLRRRFGTLVRQEVGRTVVDPGDVEKEIRHLLAVAAA